MQEAAYASEVTVGTVFPALLFRKNSQIGTATGNIPRVVALLRLVLRLR
jgi:hypothetical protein